MFWSLAAIGHAVAHLYNGPAIPSIDISASTGFAFVSLVGTVAGFSLARFALGARRGGQLPGLDQGVAEWFPKKERALATGIFNSGTNVGALVAPLVVPWITLTWGWSWAFIITGALGFLWLVGVAARCTTRRASIHRSRRRSWPTSRAIRSNPCTPVAVEPAASAPADVGVRGRASS